MRPQVRVSVRSVPLSVGVVHGVALDAHYPGTWGLLQIYVALPRYRVKFGTAYADMYIKGSAAHGRCIALIFTNYFSVRSFPSVSAYWMLIIYFEFVG